MSGLARVASVLVLAAAAAAQDSPTPFATRLQGFQTWFAATADAHKEALGSGDRARVAAVAKELRAHLDEVSLGLGFGVEPRTGEGPFRIYFEPGKDRLRQLCGRALAETMQAVQKGRDFEFVPWRVPVAADAVVANLGKTPVVWKDFVMVCQFDETKVGLVVHAWHPAFGQLKENERQQLAQRAVERGLGGAMAQRWLRSVHVLDGEPTADNEDLARGADLRTTAIALLQSLQRDPKPAPEQAADTYGPPTGEQRAGSRNADIWFGNSRLPDLIYDLHLGGKPETVQRLAANGITAAFVAVVPKVHYNPFDQKSKDAVFELQSQLEKVIEQRLAEQRLGTVIGSGIGRDRVYVDVLLFDATKATAILGQVVQGNDRLRTATLHSFDPTSTTALTTLAPAAK